MTYTLNNIYCIHLIHTIKMYRLLLTLFAILAIFSMSDAQTTPCCPENEIWSRCDGTCQPTCINPEIMCIKQCVPGCRCQNGWLRNRFGKCVSPEDCSCRGQMHVQ